MFPHISASFACTGMTFFNGLYIKKIRNSPGGWGIMSKEPMWTFDVNDITQNNSYVQLLTMLCMLQPLLW